jgi:mitochondrial inner membrane protease ATP23
MSSQENTPDSSTVDPTSPTSRSPNGTGYTPGETFQTKWSNIFNILAGRMSDEGKEQFRLAKDIKNEEADCKRCEGFRDYLFSYSMIPPIFDRERKSGPTL